MVNTVDLTWNEKSDHKSNKILLGIYLKKNLGDLWTRLNSEEELG